MTPDEAKAEARLMSIESKLEEFEQKFEDIDETLMQIAMHFAKLERK